MTGICKLCSKEKVIKNSHIIPEFMYQNLYDQNPRRFYIIKVDLVSKQKSFKRIEQKGIREYLLCGDCEQLLSSYENYAAETIYAKNKGNRTFSKKDIKTPDEQFFLYEYAGFSYKDFKIFLISLLWRICISKTYNIQIDEGSIEKMRLSIFHELPLEFDEFGCIVQVLKYEKLKIAGGFILAPFKTTNNGNECVNILIDGFMFSFYINSKELAQNTKSNFLQKNGNMNVIGKVIFQDKGLLDMLKTASDYFTSINQG